MYRLLKLAAYLILVFSVLVTPALSQNDYSSDDTILSNQKRSAIISKIDKVFNELYPLEDVAVSMTDYINGKYRRYEYDSLTEIPELTAKLTSDLREISNDHHIKIYPYEKIPDDLAHETKLGSPEDNFGFHKVEILPGNIGYIELVTFNNPKSAGATAIAAMNFVANCDALIFDLRLNGGGDTDMGILLCSYLFDKRTHLTDIYTRSTNTTEEVWTMESVAGPKLTDIPVYILLSGFSYSATEAFSYQLQQLGKATIIGQKTKGGAHSVKYMSFPELGINMKVPYTSDINPYSKTNYINGIIPDIETPTDKAFIVANFEACKYLLESEEAEDTRYLLEWTMTYYESDMNQVTIDSEILLEYAGVYGESDTITVKCNRIFYTWGRGGYHELVPMGNDLFKYAEENYAKYRVQFVRDIYGEIVELYELDSDGDTYPAQKRVGN